MGYDIIFSQPRLLREARSIVAQSVRGGMRFRDGRGALHFTLSDFPEPLVRRQIFGQTLARDAAPLPPVREPYIETHSCAIFCVRKG